MGFSAYNSEDFTVLSEVTPFATKTIRLLEGDLFVFTVDARGMYVDMPKRILAVHDDMSIPEGTPVQVKSTA